MALVLIEGFDHFDAGGGNATGKGWNTVLASSGATVSQVTGRINGKGMKLTGTSANDFIWGKSLPTSYATVITGFAFQTTVPFVSSNTTFFQLRDITFAASAPAQIRIQTNGKLQVLNNSGTVIASGNTVLAANTWYYIELKIFVNGGSGTCELHLNGVTEIASTAGNFGSTNIGALTFARPAGGVGTPGNLSFDDLYICDSSGVVNNDFLGDVHVETIMPTADGTHTDWTPNSGVNHFDRVNQANDVDGDTTYNSDATVGHIDSYAYADLSISSGPIFGVQTNLWSRKDDATLRQLKALIRRGVTDYTPGATQTMAASYVDYTDIFEQDPSTSAAWLISGVNAAEFGVKVVT